MKKNFLVKRKTLKLKRFFFFFKSLMISFSLFFEYLKLLSMETNKSVKSSYLFSVFLTTEANLGFFSWLIFWTAFSWTCGKQMLKLKKRSLNAKTASLIFSDVPFTPALDLPSDYFSVSEPPSQTTSSVPYFSAGFWFFTWCLGGASVAGCVDLTSDFFCTFFPRCLKWFWV